MKQHKINAVLSGVLIFGAIVSLAKFNDKPVLADAPKIELTQKITVAGSNSAWTTIASIKPHTLIKLHAEGSVNFGGHFATDDDALAGVDGNAIGKWFQSLTDSNWEEVVANPAKYPEVIKLALGGDKPVNFNQGGVWIKVVDHETGAVISPPQLYYYWDKALNQLGLVSGCSVDVLAKAHDGGKDPDATNSYEDNTGQYVVWLEVSSAPSTSFELDPDKK